jgi:digeranylgeranylglycerophospholipid reductase
LYYDVLVVGAGPAGLSAARAAAKRGASVLVVEQEQAVAEHVRTSGVTWISDANELGIPAELYNPVSVYNFVSKDNSACVGTVRPEACVLNVRGTYQYLAGRAGDAGAGLWLRTRALRPLIGKDGKVEGMTVHTRGKGEQEVRAGVVIDASGFGSVVAKDVGLATKWANYGVGAEYEAFVERYDETQWYLMVGSLYSPAGYAWIFPVGKNRVRIGVGVGRPGSDENPANLVDGLLEKRPGPLARLGRITPIEFHYGLVPNGGLRERLVGKGVALVGDSAGQANPLVLEGIRYAIRYGSLLGDAAAGALGEGMEERLAAEYERRCRNEVESKIKAAQRIQSRWLSLDDHGWDKELDIIKELKPEEFIEFIRADFGVATIARLATKHPKVVVREFFGMAMNALRSIA